MIEELLDMTTFQGKHPMATPFIETVAQNTANRYIDILNNPGVAVEASVRAAAIRYGMELSGVVSPEVRTVTDEMLLMSIGTDLSVRHGQQVAFTSIPQIQMFQPVGDEEKGGIKSGGEMMDGHIQTSTTSARRGVKRHRAATCMSADQACQLIHDKGVATMLRLNICNHQQLTAFWERMRVQFSSILAENRAELRKAKKKREDKQGSADLNNVLRIRRVVFTELHGVERWMNSCARVLQVAAPQQHSPLEEPEESDEFSDIAATTSSGVLANL